jgi:glutamyl-tRNA synthetase
MTSNVRVRFAPSPTGFLHVGGARTALFNYCWAYARRHGGKFILRIEDTDKARNTGEATRAIYEGMRWLGLDWDEGPQAGGDHGPYFQSEREAVYQRYFDKLQAAGRLYEDGGAWRFKFERKMIVMEDEVCGRIEIDMANVETNPDMTIRRPDGGWIFHFVNVVDDIEMGITHVIRGEDHLSNTPKHIQLYQALGVTPPKFAHIPLIMNKDGSKMSKRDQGASVAAYIEGGYLPEAVRNFLCLLGWSPKDNREKLPIDEIVRIFTFANINRKGATFDLEKCTWLNGEYARELPDDRFFPLAVEALKHAGVPLEKFPETYVKAALETCKGKFRLFTELPAYCGFYFTDDIAFNPEGVVKHFVPENKPRLVAVRDAFSGAPAFDAATLETTLKAAAAALGVKVGVLVHPTRLAVTGSNAGPSLYHLLEILGRDKVLARIDHALAQPGFAG